MRGIAVAEPEYPMLRTYVKPNLGIRRRYFCTQTSITKHPQNSPNKSERQIDHRHQNQMEHPTASSGHTGGRFLNLLLISSSLRLPPTTSLYIVYNLHVIEIFDFQKWSTWIELCQWFPSSRYWKLWLTCWVSQAEVHEWWARSSKLQQGTLGSGSVDERRIAGYTAQNVSSKLTKPLMPSQTRNAARANNEGTWTGVKSILKKSCCK